MCACVCVCMCVRVCFLQFGVLFLLESARLSIFLSTCGFKKCVVILSCVVTHSMNCLLCLVINST
jgi:hypothetical protein